ncbi:hypothetical protein JY64_08610, partial [Neisseria meningitidis]
PTEYSLFAEEEQYDFELMIENQIKEHEKEIDYYVTDYPIETLVAKLDRQELFIPDYQRKNIWEKHRKSRFIESVLIGLPIPFLFFWQDPSTGNMEVVDGAQRLTALSEFIHGNLKLSYLEKLIYLNGQTYHQLLESRQKIFKNKPIRGVVLSNKTDKEARLDLFERLNTGSKNATPAEIRRGLLQGAFYDMVETLSEDKTFNELAKISKNMQDMGEREEFITRFFAYGEYLDHYSANVRKFIFDYTEIMNEEFAKNPNMRATYEQKFHEIMAFFKEKYPIGFKRDGKGQSSRTRFEGMAVSAYL